MVCYKDKPTSPLHSRGPLHPPTVHCLSLLPMVVVSSLRKTNLPDELERMIFLLASREPCELANYVRVARRVKAWIEPILYMKITILSEAHARSLLHSLTTRPKTVFYLHTGMSVPPGTVALLLRRCPRLINFSLHGGGNSLCQFRVIVNALNSLKNLRYFSIDPALFFHTHFAYLPDTPTFHRITHLDLTTQWTFNTIASGLKSLYRLTHLSMTWKMSRLATHDLVALLQHRDFKLILLWLDEIDGQPRVIKDLLKRGLDDPRIVLLRRASNWAMELSGGFWLHAERIIAWRKENNITTMQRPTMSDDVASIYMRGLDYQSLQWERDTVVDAVTGR